jgi:hypothetical protein
MADQNKDDMNRGASMEDTGNQNKNELQEDAKESDQ